MRTLKLTIAYDGTGYVGWQRQARGVSIQALIEDALAPFDDRRVPVVGSGRTDAGVHALAQVASVVLEHEVPPADLARAVNARLPPAVRVLAVEVVPEGFNARYAAAAKTYRYRILQLDVADPFERFYSWHVPFALDAGRMRSALRLVEGRHDFSGFQAAGSRVRSPVRTIYHAALTRGRELPVERRDDVLVIEMTGDGFLRHMVRNIVGTLVEVGAGRRHESSIGEVLASGNRAGAGPTAPAHGLYLVRVFFEPPPMPPADAP